MSKINVSVSYRRITQYHEALLMSTVHKPVATIFNAEYGFIVIGVYTVSLDEVDWTINIFSFKL